MDTSLFHSLQSENIYFKSLSVDDTQEVHNYASDAEVSRFIGWQLMQNLNDTRLYIKEMLRREEAGTHLYASIVLKLTHEIIGTTMIFNLNQKAKHAEIGYVFHSRHWGFYFHISQLKHLSINGHGKVQYCCRRIVEIEIKEST